MLANHNGVGALLLGLSLLAAGCVIEPNPSPTDPYPGGSDGFDGQATPDAGTGGQTATDGTTGTDGTSGADGTDGTSGFDGTDGSDATDGTGGTDATEGTDGVDALDGIITVDCPPDAPQVALGTCPDEEAISLRMTANITGPFQPCDANGDGTFNLTDMSLNSAMQQWDDGLQAELLTNGLLSEISFQLRGVTENNPSCGLSLDIVHAVPSQSTEPNPPWIVKETWPGCDGCPRSGFDNLVRSDETISGAGETVTFPFAGDNPAQPFLVPVTDYQVRLITEANVPTSGTLCGTIDATKFSDDTEARCGTVRSDGPADFELCQHLMGLATIMDKCPEPCTFVMGLTLAPVTLSATRTE